MCAPLPSVLVVVPVLGRPERAAALAASLRASEGRIPLRLVFACTPDDVEQLAACRDTGAGVLVATWPAGPADWAKKINAAYRSSVDPWIFTGADDLHFHEGWAEAALAVADSTGAQVVGTNDLGNPRVKKGSHSTHSLVARAYADERGTIDGPGAVVSETYDHNFVDDELVLTAKTRGLFAFAAGALVEHLHPNWRKGEEDATYEKGMARFAHDQRLFHQRAAAIRGTRGRRAPVGVEVRGGRWERRRPVRPPS